MSQAVNKSTAIKWAVTLLLGLGLYALVPVNGVITPQIRNYLAISIVFIVIVALELLPNLVSSLLLPCAYIALGVADGATALAPWTNTLIYMVIAALVFTNIMTDCGLLRRIALSIVNKAGGSFMGLVFALYGACLVMSYVSFVQGWLLMASLGVALCKTMGYKAGDRESLILMTAVLCGSLSTCVYTYNPSLCPIMEQSEPSGRGTGGFYQRSGSGSCPPALHPAVHPAAAFHGKSFKGKNHRHQGRNRLSCRRVQENGKDFF